MHDDVPLTTGRTKRVLEERIWPAVHSRTAPVSVAWHPLPGEPIPPADGLDLDYTPYQVGTPWGPAWGTTWFKITGSVPEEWAGRRVELVCDLGFDVNMPGFQCEGLVYTALGDGSVEPVKSLNPRNQWVLVADEAAGGEEVELYLEAASNPVLLDYHPFLPTQQGDIETASRTPLYESRRIELACFEREVFELALDLETLLELQAELPAGPRKMQILQALDDALDRVDLQRIAETAADAREPLAGVLAKKADASAHRIAAIGHAHIDSAWLWPVRETIRKVARTCASMTELIGEDADFRYGMSSAQQYAWLKEHRPEVFGRVRKAVADGRFVPLGGMWVESDTVMPSGESLVRQFLYGQRFFETELGVRCHGVWLPDSFGYSPALPQLMRRAGFEWFFTQKISWNQVNRFPHHTFSWEGIDGSRILSHFPPMDTYNSRLSGEEVAKASRQFRESRVATGSIAPVGWGDGGGGTTREMAGKARRLADLEGSARVRWAHPDEFFDEARAELPNPPVWVGELYLELHRATLTSQHRTKQGNRRTEHLLVEAELWSATAAARGLLDYPYDELDALWQQVLLQQFHDILPGTSIAWVHREAVAEYARITAAAEAIVERALGALAGVGSQELVADGLSGVISLVEPPEPLGGGVSRPTASDRVGLDTDSLVPRESGSTSDGGSTCDGGSTGDAAQGEVTLEETPDGYVLRNDLVTVRVSREGLITSALDHATGRDAIPAGSEGNLLQLHQDFPNMWDAWDVDRFYRNRVTDLREVGSITVEREGEGDGEVRLVIERPISEHSATRQVLSLAAGSRVLVIDQTTDWHETEKFLKVAFPLDVRAEQTLAETQFGYQRRVTHTNTSWEAAKFETSMHRWVLAEEPGFGVALVNDSTYGFDVTRPDALTTCVRLSLLRAPRFPDPETDQGEQTHRYGLVIGADVAAATEAGARLNTRERRLTGDHGVEPLVAVTGDGLVVSSVKLAADRSGDLVVRVYEALGRRTTGELAVYADITSASEVTLLEEPVADAPALPTSGTVPLRLGAFEVRTLRFRVRAEEA